MDPRRLARLCPSLVASACLSLLSAEEARQGPAAPTAAEVPAGGAATTRHGPTSVPAPTGPLTREQALALALEHHPALASAGYAIEAAEALVLQALARPYPEAEIEVEDIGSTGDRAGLGDAVTTVRLGQTLETGRKREARTRLAERDRDLGGWDNRSLREDVRRDTAAQFAGVLAAQQRLRLLQNAGALAERLLATVSARVAAGKDSPSEQNKANVALANRRLELRRAEGDLAGARVRLAALWGATEATFAEASGDLAAIPELPELARLLEALATNPDLARWSTEEAQRTAALALARAGRAPDVTVGAGVAWSGAEDDATFEVSASVPLPIWDRNQGAIREAAAELRKATAERHAVETGLRAALIAQHQELATARQEALGLRDEVLPEARRALELAQTAFAQGKTTYLDVVDAQQTLFEAEWQHVEALAACHAAVAEIERTAGPRTNR